MRRLTSLLIKSLLGLLAAANLILVATGHLDELENPSHSKDVWVQALKWLFSTPWWVTSSLLVLLVVATHWGSIRKLIGLDEIDAPRSARDASPSSAQTLSPDLSIRDLFFYVNPGCLEENGLDANRIGRELLDALSTGRMQAWGRPERTDRPLTEIAKSYWDKARFTYWFFEDDSSTEVHAEPLRGITSEPCYRDLRFNSAQAQSIWPPEERPKLPEYVGVIRAFLAVTSDSKWAKDLIAHPERFEFDVPYPNSIPPEMRVKYRLKLQLERDLHDALRSGKISAEGRPSRDAPLRPIEKQEWDKIKIILDNIAFEQARDNACAMSRATGSIVYMRIVVNRSDIKKFFGLRSL